MVSKYLTRKNLIVLIISTIIALVNSLIFIRIMGIKDSLMLFLATFLLVIEIYFAKNNKQTSILLFILSFPILVTARKIFYFNVLFIKISYETIYISIISLFSIREILLYIKNKFSSKLKGDKSFIILIILFIIFSLNSTLFSSNILKSLSGTFISILIPIMFMFSIIVNFTNKDIYKLYYAAVAGIDFSCIYGFSQIVTNNINFKNIVNNRDILTFGYHNINIFANILTMVMPITVAVLIYRKTSIKEKLFLYISILINVFALYITYTRGAWISFIISIFIILFDKKFIKYIYALIIMMIVFSRPIFSYILGRGSNINILSSESTVARIQSYFTCLKIILKYPFGIGVENFPELYKKFAIDGYWLMPEKIRWNVTAANYTLEMAHNLWLQIAVDFGVITMVIFGLILINRFKIIFRDFKANRVNFASIVIFIIFSVLTGVEFDHKGVITGTLLLWMFFAIIQLNVDIKEEGMVNEANN